MRRFVFVTAAAAALFSCQKPMFDSMPRGYERSPLALSSKTAEEAEPAIPDSKVKPGIYYTAVQFPHWADWREGDFRGAEVVLYRDSIEIASAPGGPRPGQERIRLWEGHLWSDIADGGETVVYCDGYPYLTIPEEVLLKGLVTENGNIHTLGQRPGSQGVSYRVNGEELFSSSSGAVLGGMYLDQGRVFYTFGIPVKRGESVIMEYHVMQGADERAVVTETGTGKIYDIRVRDGTLYRCERRTGESSSLCIVTGDQYVSVGAGADEPIHQCNLIWLDGEVMIKGYSVFVTGYLHWIRSREGYKYFAYTHQVTDLYADGDAFAYVSVDRNGLAKEIVLGEETVDLGQDRPKLMNSRGADFRDGTFAAAFTDPESTDNRVYMGGKWVYLDFNGYFTSLTIIK